MLFHNLSSTAEKSDFFIKSLMGVPLYMDINSCKYFYRQFIDKNTVVPVNIINKWSNGFDIEETEWGLIFSEPFSLSKNNKLSCFQYNF
jgi:hypothetical protein